MLSIKRLPLGTMAANCYLIFEDVKHEAFLIDPGDEAEFLSRVILERNLKTEAIILTHGHFDHSMVAGELKLTLGVKVYANAKDRFLFSKMPLQAKKYTGEVALPFKLDSNLKDGQILSLGKYRFEVWATPGHTPGSISLIERKEKIAIVGDLFFADASVGRYDFPYSKKEKLFGSVTRFLSLAPSTRIYPGHGEDFLLKSVKKYLNFK